MIRVTFCVGGAVYVLELQEGREQEVLELAAKRIFPTPDPARERESAMRFEAMMRARKKVSHEQNRHLRLQRQQVSPKEHVEGSWATIPPSAGAASGPGCL